MCCIVVVTFGRIVHDLVERKHMCCKHVPFYVVIITKAASVPLIAAHCNVNLVDSHKNNDTGTISILSSNSQLRK